MALLLGAAATLAVMGGVSRHYTMAVEQKKEEKEQEHVRLTTTGGYGDMKDVMREMSQPGFVKAVEPHVDLNGVPCVFLVGANGIRYKSYDLWTPRF